MDNPYFYAKGLADHQGPAKKIITVTPSDTDTLPQVCKKLRLYNPGDGTEEIVIHAIGNDEGDNSTLKVPAGHSELNVFVDQVLETGTDAGIEIHGYSD